MRVALPHDQLPLLERVEQRHEAARIERQRGGDRRLRLADALVEDREDAVVVQLEPCLLGSGDRLRLEAHAEPREQKTAALRQFLRDPLHGANGDLRRLHRHHEISVAPKRCFLITLNDSTIWETKR